MAKSKPQNALDRIKRISESSSESSQENQLSVDPSDAPIDPSPTSSTDPIPASAVKKDEKKDTRAKKRKGKASTPLGRIQGFHETHSPVTSVNDIENNVEAHSAAQFDTTVELEHKAPEAPASSPTPSKEKKRKKGKAPSPSAPYSPPSPPTAEDYERMEAELERKELVKARKEKRKAKRARALARVTTFLLIVGCVYMLFLIYGALNTEYVYNEDGEKVAQRLTVEQLRELDNFNLIATSYRQSRTLYEQVLLLDYRLGAGAEDPLLIAPEYEKLLETVEKLSIEISALTVPSEYTQIKQMLYAWVSTDIAVYCQNMSVAISQNNALRGEEALAGRTATYNDFYIITDNLTAMADTVHGAEYKDIQEWSPESFVRDAVGTLE